MRAYISSELFLIFTESNNLLCSCETGDEIMLTLDAFTHDALKDLARAKSLSPAGSKTELVLRLQQFIDSSGSTLEALLGISSPAAATGSAVLPPVNATAPPTPAPSFHLPPPPPFDLSEEGRQSRWAAYKTDFSTFLRASGSNIADGQKLALFLHCAGPGMKRFVETLSLPQQPTFDVVLRSITDKFTPIDATLFELYRLGELHQNPGESTDSYVARLKRQAQFCNLKCSACQASHEDSRILDVLLRHTRLKNLRQRVFEQGVVDLDRVLSMARAMETAAHHEKVMSQDSPASAAIAQAEECILARKSSKPRSSGSKKAEPSHSSSSKPPSDSVSSCIWCGKSHKRSRQDCPARDQTCGSCGTRGHFSAVCKKKRSTTRPAARLAADSPSPETVDYSFCLLYTSPSPRDA